MGKRKSGESPKLDRKACAAQIVKEFVAVGKPCTMELLAERADQLFVAQDPAKHFPNIALAEWGVEAALATLIELGAVHIVVTKTVHVDLNHKNGGSQK
jgi:hypothetical protein